MRSELREKALQLRLKEQLSYSEIRRRLGVPKSTLSYWLRAHPLSEEKIIELRKRGWSKGEASRERYRNTMRERQKNDEAEALLEARKKIAGLGEEAFFSAGLMLYLAEGGKKDKYHIALANTDSRVLRFWIRWLYEILNIEQDSLRAQLHLYENMDIEKEVNFWQNELRFRPNQFYKHQIRPLRKASFTYSGSHLHGTCQISYSNKESKMKLMSSIEALLDRYEDE